MVDDELNLWLEHTKNLIADLIADGTNEEVHHTIEHHFSSVSFEILEAAAVTAFKMGLEVEEPEEAELENGDKVFAFDIVTEQALEFEILWEETQTMFALAKKCNVDYDGWGTYFEDEEE
jgi:regulator of RNase E activity RraB